MNINKDMKHTSKNTYLELPGILYTKQMPTPVKEPEMIIFNEDLSKSLGLNKTINESNATSVLVGNTILEDSIPISQSYAGHQFGHFTILGDGRAILISEHITPDLERIDIQLKGSGETPYSRRGDGRATLSSMLREYIISEAMASLHIKTTRSLAVVSTGEQVIREQIQSGAVLTRISKGHIRVGTFQFAALKDTETIKALADYTFKRFYPEIDSTNPYITLLDKVVDAQAELIAKWQQIGFIHGVMNTDNMSIAGETIDYGPCAFMDTYHPNTVFSSIDQQGRYSYKNQPLIAQWNLARFAETLIPLLHDDQNKAIKIAESSIEHFTELYETYWLNGMRKKIGLFTNESSDRILIEELLDHMAKEKLDFTNTFIDLMTPNYRSPLKTIDEWLLKWHDRLNKQAESFEESMTLMRSVNPYVIPRNHQVELALKDAVMGDMSAFTRLLEVLKSPFEHKLNHKQYTLPPEPSKEVYKTYCGT
ncbi:MAG: YdiU family protein [Clostridiales bacterium]|nr:YdiU family protein [Clostridiales bacterium]